jgi:hypothetical protein
MSIWRQTNSTARPANAEPRKRRPRRANLSCELLELRELLSADGTSISLSQLTAQTNYNIITAAQSGPTGLTPAEIRSAYGVNLISFSGGKITGNGAGQTIAIVDAYNDPNIAADLAKFDQQFSLPAPPSFKVDNLGATTTDPGWALETALDVEWAHAIAPEANIVLVEASSANLLSLLSAASYVGGVPGVSVVSMSWGTNEFYGEWNYISAFRPAHNDVAFVAASGDQGAWSGPSFPSVAPNVLAVGGTTLTLGAGSSYAGETGWTYSTGGFSGFDNGFQSGFTEPSYQTAALTAAGLSYGVRTTPDVSFNADPSSGVAVYDSVGYNGQSGWFDLGGTSAAAPAWAGLIAITDQGLATAGKGSLSTPQLLTDLYTLPSSDFHDITSGFNGYFAQPGYDLVTGLGSPKSNLVVADLLAANGVSASTATVASTSTTTVASTHSHSSGRRFDQVATSNNPAASGSGASSGSGSGGMAAVSAATGVPAASAQGIAPLTPLASVSAPELPHNQSVAETAPPTAGGTGAAPSLGQSLLQPSRSNIWETGDTEEPVQLIDAIEPTPAPAPAPSAMSAPGELPAPDSGSKESPEQAMPAGNGAPVCVDVAIAHLFTSALPGTSALRDDEAVNLHEGFDTRPTLSASAFVGSIVTAAGYQFVLRQPDDQKRSYWCSARFRPT